MIETWTLEKIAALRESEELEVKLAAGRTGSGELPQDFWPTYSAFANGTGGYVVLGVRERNDTFEIDRGIVSPSHIVSQIFNLACNRQKVSANLLTAKDVQVIDVAGKKIILVHVRAATRQEKPVFIDGNPLTGTYRRINDGDRLCGADIVRRMLAEQTEDSRDNRVLQGFGLEDLSSDSIDIYRRMLRDARPGHPFLEQPSLQFLQSLRAWRRDRESGQDGLTVAGLLMFGTSEAIRDEFPNYTVDYQERDEPRADRWVDRLTNDGTWSGNLFDFYRLVWRKLVAGLKVPFQLVGAQRHDETSAHEALREALVNAIVHADFTGRASILVVRRPDMFGFRNPGDMRVPAEIAVRGGESDGRNRTLQQMFLLVGAGERAGSGVPKIHKGWLEQHWRPPALYELREPSEQTLLELRMEDLLPLGVVEALQKCFGSSFDQLQSNERVILATAYLETTVSHARAMTICEVHPVDLTRLLQSLVQRGFLEKVGLGRGTKYHLPGAILADPETVFTGAPSFSTGKQTSEPSDLREKPSDLQEKPSDLREKPSDLREKPSESDSEGLVQEEADSFGRLVPGLDMPMIDDLSMLNPELATDLKNIASVASGRRISRDRMQEVILRLCDGRFVTLRVLAELLDRAEDYLRPQYLNPLARDGKIRFAFPQTPNNPRQAYAASAGEESKQT